MGKKGAMEMSVWTIIVIVLLMTVLILGFVLVKNILDREYHIYKATCTLDNVVNSRCNEKEIVDSIELNNLTYTGEDLDEEVLNEFVKYGFCRELKKRAWGCGEHLIIYE